jgi:hypothetical protein
LIRARRLENHEKELFRNITLFWVATLFFGWLLLGPQQYLIFTFLIILMGYYISKKHNITFMFGIVLIIVSLLILSIIYRWGVVQYSNTDRVLLLLIVIISPLGEFLLLKDIKMSYRIIWSFIIFAVVMWETSHAASLLALPLKGIANNLTQFIDINKFTLVQRLYGDHIRGDPEIFLAYGVFFVGPALIMWVFLSLLYYTLLKKENFTSE